MREPAMFSKRSSLLAVLISGFVVVLAFAAPPPCEIPTIEKDLSYYHGEHQTQASPGWEESDFEKVAEQEALAELGKSIRVTIESGENLHVQWYQNGDQESFAQSYREFIKTYGNVLIPHYEKRTCLDYPAKGMVTVLVFGRKDEIEKQIARDLQDKTTGVRSLIDAADRAMAAHDQVLGLRQLLKAQEQLHKSFKYDEPASLNAEIARRMIDFLAGLRLSAAPNTVRFDPAGRPMAAITVRARFGDKNLPVADLPVSFAFRKGSGKLSARRVTTDSHGTAVVPLVAATPSSNSATLEIHLDRSAFPGLPAGVNRPHCSVALARGRTIAFAVRRLGEAARSSHPDIEDNIVSLIASEGLSPVRLDSSDDATMFPRAHQTGADYILLVDLKAAVKANPDDNELHVAESSSLVSLKRLDGDAAATSSEGPSERSGVFPDAAAALDNSLDKLQPPLLDLIKRKVAALPK